jgi:hypothetical protein
LVASSRKFWEASLDRLGEYLLELQRRRRTMTAKSEMEKELKE